MTTQFDGRVWDVLGERANLLAGEGWRYLPRGGARHKLDGLSVGGRSVCGVAADLDYWRGTGSQDEYERLARIPKCVTCMRLTTPT